MNLIFNKKNNNYTMIVRVLFTLGIIPSSNQNWSTLMWDIIGSEMFRDEATTTWEYPYKRKWIKYVE